MKITFRSPRNNELKKIIEGFYIVNEDSINSDIQYLTFPNNYNIFSIFQNASITYNNAELLIYSNSNCNIESILINHYVKPIKISYKGITREITIYFKPLGINYFTKIGDICKRDHLFNFNLLELNECEELFNIENPDLKFDKLEEFLLYRINKIDLSFIELLIKQVEGNNRIKDISMEIECSRKYIHELFLKYLGKTPSQYRKIHRFRNSLREFSLNKKLTELTYENNFFDQSHLIKDFKSLTTYQPSFFLKNVDTTQKNVWLFI